MPLAIFDLDGTILEGDTDLMWGRYLVERGVMTDAEYDATFGRFMREYRRGTLDIRECLGTYARLYNRLPRAVLDALRDRFVPERVLPATRPAVLSRMAAHGEAGDRLLILTATNAYLTRAVASGLGVADLLASELEERDGVFTGGVVGEPCFREGKVARLRGWLAREGASLAGSWFYSDSHNDLPLLSLVDNPVAVDPDGALLAHARAMGWQVMGGEGVAGRVAV